MPTIVLISNHYYHSYRRAGFHLLADSFARKSNWNVVFVTAPISLIQLFLKNPRFKYPIIRQKNKVIDVNKNLKMYIYLTNVHPLQIPYGRINGIIEPFIDILVRYYGKSIPSNLKEIFSSADIIVFESNVALLLYEKVCEMNPEALKVYRVSDDLEAIYAPKKVIAYEKAIAPSFDMISVPSEYIYQKFNHLSQTRLHHHGVQKELFFQQYAVPEPYKNFQKNFIFVGTGQFDFDFIQKAANLFSEWGFHIIGPINEQVSASNILYYGEMSFHMTIPFIKYADVGLHCLKTEFGLQSFTDSLKVLQYTYCKLPIIAPLPMQSSRKHFIYYDPGNKTSIHMALQKAVEYDRSIIDTSNIFSWDELTDIILSEI